MNHLLYYRARKGLEFVSMAALAPAEQEEASFDDWNI